MAGMSIFVPCQFFQLSTNRNRRTIAARLKHNRMFGPPAENQKAQFNFNFRATVMFNEGEICTGLLMYEDLAAMLSLEAAELAVAEVQGRTPSTRPRDADERETSRRDPLAANVRRNSRRLRPPRQQEFSYHPNPI